MNKILFLIIILTSQIFSQSISGKVFDKTTGFPLANCNISVIGTNCGTISNINGKYLLKLSSGKNELLFQFMGYKSDTVHVKFTGKNITHDVYLSPQIYLLDDIIVYAGSYSEAEQLILRASQEKRKALNLVKNYNCKSYTMLTLSGLADSLKDRYALLNEIYSEIIWNSPDYWHEVVLSQKVSANLPESINFLSGNTFLNINSDRINLGNRIIIGPTAPDAIYYYNYEILDTLYQDDKRIFHLSIAPKGDSRPLMSGDIFLLDKLYLVQKIDVHLNKHANYELFEDIHVVQHYKCFNDSVYLPYYSIKECAFVFNFPGYPKLWYRKTNFREDYQINNSNNEYYSGQTKLIFQNEMPFNSIPMNIPPLSKEEEKAYAQIDSIVNHNIFVNLIIKSIKVIDFYARFKSQPVGEFSDFYRFNRVEGNFIGAAVNTKLLLKPFRLYTGYGYGFSDENSKYFFLPEFKLSSKKTAFSVRYGRYKSIFTREKNTEFPIWLNTFYSHFSFDYFDYYYADGSEVSLNFLQKPLFLFVSYYNERHSKAFRNISSGTFSNQTFIDNPMIDEGNLIGLKFNFNYSTASYRESNLYKKLFKYRNYFEIAFDFESGFKKWGSDYHFNRYFFSLFLRQNTFYKGFLDLMLFSGYGTTGIPFQRYFELESDDLSGYDRFKTFRTLSLNSYVGRKKLEVFIEHNFQNSIFHFTCIPIIKDIPWDFSVIYNIGWAGDQPLDQLNMSHLYSEAGIGFGRIFNFFKLEFLWGLKNIPQSKDFTWNLKVIEIEL
jgi:hypothetical protein